MAQDHKRVQGRTKVDRQQLLRSAKHDLQGHGQAGREAGRETQGSEQVAPYGALRCAAEGDSAPALLADRGERGRRIARFY